MSLTLPKLPPVANQWVERIGGPRRAGMVGIALLSVVLILGVAHWAAAPEWVPLMREVPLDRAGEITDKLSEAGIEYRLEDRGTQLLVASSDLARARVTLARDGGMDMSGRPGLEIFDKPSWGMTDFTQRINYRRALEGELERTISKMSGVESAKVHLALSESPGFRQANRPENASVVLKLTNGQRPDADVVRGIEHLVASSVDGIGVDNVSVLDNTGRLLSSPFEAGSPAAAATRELEQRRAVEQYLETKAEQLVGRMVGNGNVRVQVSADISYDKVDRQTEMVDPDNQVVASEQRAEIVPGAEGGAGSSNVTANYLNSRTIETFSGATGGIRRLTVAVLVNEAAAANGKAWSPQEIARVEGLVKNAVGINAGRGDEISVASVPFRDEAMETPPAGLAAVLLPFMKPGVIMLALLGVLAVTFIVLRALKTPKPEPARVPSEVPLVTAGDDEEIVEELIAQTQAVPALPSVRDLMRDEVTSRITGDPERSVRVVRSWLKED